MKLNSTVALTLSLLILMLGSGYISAIWGFTIGHEAVKGVTQPDGRPASRAKLRQAGTQQQRAVVMLKEADIVAAVKARIEGKGKQARPEKPQPENKDNPFSQDKSAPPETKTPTPEPQTFQPGFPIANQNQGVTLEVVSADYTGGALQLKLNFKNEGARTIRFLYSFLTVTDDQGRALSANTEGLPGELPPNGKPFSGIVSIPTALLSDVQKISMSLTDYPEQQLQLQMSNIPVKR